MAIGYERKTHLLEVFRVVAAAAAAAAALYVCLFLCNVLEFVVSLFHHGMDEIHVSFRIARSIYFCKRIETSLSFFALTQLVPNILV